MIMVYEAVLALRICQALSMPVKLVQVHISVRRDKTYSLNSSVKGYGVSLISQYRAQESSPRHSRKHNRNEPND